MYVFMHTCIIYFIMILFCSHGTQALMCGWVLKQLGILKSYDFLAQWEGGVRKQWRGIMCVLLCSSGQRAQSVIGAIGGREEGSSLQWETRNMTSVTLRGTWPVSEGRSRERRPGRFCMSWLLAQGQYSVPMLLTCSSLQCGEASHCAR